MLNSILLQAGAAGGSNGITTILMMGGIAIVFYFFMIRPQQKKQKDQKKFIEEIKKGDTVVTIGGIHGKVVEVKDSKLILDVDGRTKIEFDKSAISKENSTN